MITIHDILNDLKRTLISEAELMVDSRFVNESEIEDLVDEAEGRIFDVVDQIKE